MIGKFDTNARSLELPGLFYVMKIFVLNKRTTTPRSLRICPQKKMSSKPPPPEEDPREWLLFDIEDQDPITADFLKPPPQTSPPVTAHITHLADMARFEDSSSRIEMRMKIF
jgi:hypothetical protein